MSAEPKVAGRARLESRGNCYAPVRLLFLMHDESERRLAAVMSRVVICKVIRYTVIEIRFAVCWDGSRAGSRKMGLVSGVIWALNHSYRRLFDRSQ